MKKSLSLLQAVGFFVASLLGVLLHFLYDWTNQSKTAALISGVNESTWEHMKLLFFPLFIFAVIESRFIKDREDFWQIKLVGTLTGLLAIPIIFYTLNGVFGKTPDWLNITIFFVSAALAFIVEGHLFGSDTLPCVKKQLAIAFFVIIALAFFIFTFYPPMIPLFKDPVTAQYGI